ncbi:MAG: glycosyltransferase family 39 protein [bacterium]|nr:glycosyltransferase family 39 protein [bacterium]
MKTLDPSFSILPGGTDHLNYWFFARGIFRGYWPGLSHGPFYFGPLISFYFAFCSLLFGESLTIVRIITAGLASCSILLVFDITRQVMPSPVASLAAILCACNGVLIFYDTSLLIAPLLTFLGLVCLWSLVQLRKRLSWPLTVFTGLTLGLTALARSNILLFLPCIFIWLFLSCSGTTKQKTAHFFIMISAMLLVISPVTVRNYFSSPKHPLVLTTSGGGINLWIGNNPSSSGIFGYPRQLLQETRERMKKEGTSYRDEVLRYMKEHTRDYVKLEYNKFKMFWRGYEIANLIPYYIFRRNSYILRLPWINFVLLGPLGIIGMILVRKRWKDGFILYGFVGVQLATTLLFFALARYRLPAVPVLSMFAAYTIWHTGQLFTQRKWPTLLLTIGSVAIFYAMLNYPQAASQYQKHYGESMPLIRVLRYWDLFHLP